MSRVCDVDVVIIIGCIVDVTTFESGNGDDGSITEIPLLGVDAVGIVGAGVEAGVMLKLWLI